MKDYKKEIYDLCHEWYKLKCYGVRTEEDLTTAQCMDHDFKEDYINPLVKKLEVLEMIISHFRNIRNINEINEFQVILTFDKKETDSIKELVDEYEKYEDEN